MYYKHILPITAALAPVSSAVFANGLSDSVTELPLTAPFGQTGFVGGSVGLEYGRVTGEYGEEANLISQSVSLEYAVTPKLAFAVDVERQSISYGPYDFEGNIATLHGIYSLSDNVMLGAWVNRWSSTNGD